jgi:sec-independent protein translocase protein TatB
MFDVGFAELVLLFVIGLLILGPERLPKVATQLGRWVARARRTATQLRRQLEQEVDLNEAIRPRKPPPSRPRDSSSLDESEPPGGEPRSTGQPAPDAPPPGLDAAPPAADAEPPTAASASPPAAADAEPLERQDPTARERHETRSDTTPQT